ncbi:MAG TPA: hypothetical protein VK139_08180 [Microbacteriaceae bacterium]|nr:hypothetical protein [Microbacteriaceae bacterium]
MTAMTVPSANFTKYDGNMRLIGVYDANGGFAGELAYIVGHAFGVRECALCDITHSPVAKKAAWKQLERNLLSDRGIRFTLVHRNERTVAEHEASDGLEPCVLIETDAGTLSVLVTREDLVAVHGDVAAFSALLSERLDEQLS